MRDFLTPPAISQLEPNDPESPPTQEDDLEENQFEDNPEEISFARLSETRALKLMIDLDAKMETVGDKPALRGFNSTIVVNAGGGLNPFSKNPDQLSSDSQRPRPNNKMEYVARLITERLVDKIYFTEARVTGDTGRRIAKYLSEYFPQVKMVCVPMSEHTQRAFDLGKEKTPEKEKDNGGFSGCLALMHISWWNRLVTKKTNQLRLRKNYGINLLPRWS